MANSRRLAAAFGTTVLLAATAMVVSASSATAEEAGPADEPVSWLVPDLTVTQVRGLAASGFDVAHFDADGSAIVIGDESVADELRDLGLRPQFHDTVYKDLDPAASIMQGDSYYGGYRTTAGHQAHLDQVAADNPDLAVVHDIGDSWLKTQGEGGHDITAICLTNMQDGDCELSPNSAKPRFSLIAQVHAREIATGEVAARWIDYLVDGYGSDATVTELMDTTEMWVVPIANPDGVDIVASGGNNPVLHRKNANDTYSSSCAGVDLNRNSSFEWGDDSTNPCSETYQGPSAASEPEVAALEAWFRQIHPDQRGPNPDDPASDDARDVFISLHSYGQYIIVPWGYTADTAPNDAALRALGAEMSDSNGYFVGTNQDTVGYGTSGTTDDMTYGELGVASFTFEMGGSFGQCGGFLPSYSCVDGQLWPENQGALLTAAQAATAPYTG